MVVPIELNEILACPEPWQNGKRNSVFVFSVQKSMINDYSRSRNSPLLRSVFCEVINNDMETIRLCRPIVIKIY